ncbi:hypothetical protein HY374_02205 [Candidatus Berkelbacteria bacterium]|nr:hypothetical protein [Candidatus Berkelbacteria bacterium]
MGRFFPLTGHHIAFAFYYGMRALVGLAIVGFLLDGDWAFAFYASLVLLVMIAPGTLRESQRFFLPFELDLALVAFIFLSLFLGSLNGFYLRFWWWDGMIHFQSGVLAGVVGFLLVYVLNAAQPREKLELSSGFIALFSFAFSLAIAVLWEIVEFAGDEFFGWQAQESGWPDTMGDLIMATCGAIIVAVIGYGWMRRRAQVPFTPRLLARLQYRGRQRETHRPS